MFASTGKPFTFFHPLPAKDLEDELQQILSAQNLSLSLTLLPKYSS